MRRSLLLLVTISLVSPTLLSAASMEFGGTTILRMEQRAYPGFPKQDLTPLTQFLSLESAGLADGNLSLHLAGWGRADLADASTTGDKTSGDFTYGYLRYLVPATTGEIRLGRIFQAEGGIMEQFDGGSLRTDLIPGQTGMALSVFGGRPVHRDNGNTGTSLLGGRLSGRLQGKYELGVAVVRESGLTANGPTSNLATYRQLIGGDVWLRPMQQLELNGRTYYNEATGSVAEHLYSATLTPAELLSLSFGYQRMPLRHLFSATNLYAQTPASKNSPFPTDKEDTLTSWGGAVILNLSKPVQLIGDYRHYQRDTRRDSQRFGGELRYAADSFSAGAGIHRLVAGELKSGPEPDFSSYTEYRAYTLYQLGRYEGSLDATAQQYDDAIFTKKSGFEIQGSIGTYLLPQLKLSGDLSYGDTPWLTKDVRGLIRLTFAYDALTTKGAGK